MGDLLIDISKTFGNINLDLLCSYLKNHKQKIIVNNSAGTTQTIIGGVPQGFIEELVLFN